MNDPRSLPDLQAWLQRAIVHPGGVLASASAAEIAGVVEPSTKQTALQRLNVYHQAYFARLLDVLNETFPALVQALGKDAFAELGIAYLDRHPPVSYSLNQLGDALPAFLRETRPPRGDDGALDWADFLAELAELESTTEVVFDGPGHEGAPPFDPASLSPEQLEVSTLRFTPSLRLLSFAFPVNDYYTAFRDGASPALPAPRATWVAVFRRDYVVRRWNLSQDEFLWLEAFARLPFGAALAEISAPPELLFAAFRDWTAAELICGVDC